MFPTQNPCKALYKAVGCNAKQVTQLNVAKTNTLEMVKHICSLQEKSTTVAVSLSILSIPKEKKKKNTDIFFYNYEAGHQRIGNTIFLLHMTSQLSQPIVFIKYVHGDTIK